MLEYRKIIYRELEYYTLIENSLNMITQVGTKIRGNIFFFFLFIDEIVGEAPPVPPSKKLEDLIRLAELCVDLLRQNEEFYAEV